MNISTVSSATHTPAPRSSRPWVWDSIERLETRIAPAGAALATAHFIQTNPFGDAVSDELIPPPPAVTSLPSAAEAFTSEHPGFLINSDSTDFETAGYKGSLESFVVRRTATTDAVNLPIGGLDFYYQVTVTSGDPRAAISNITLGLFNPSLVAAGYDSRTGLIVSTDPLNGRNGGTQSPVLTSYNAGTVDFDFTSETINEAIVPDSSSSWLVLRTSARSYDSDGTAGIIGDVTGVGPLSTTISVFAPTEGTPQPRTLVVTGASTGSLVQVFNPTTGALQENFNAFGAKNKYGVRVATGDVNGDGVEDIIAGSGLNSVGGAQVRVFDGASSTHPALSGVLGNFKPFGAGYVGAVNVASGDVNGDGRADIIVATGSGSSGQVRVFNGVDGSLLTKFTAFAKVNGGVRVAGGDLNGDGRDEVIVGAGVGSAVRVFDGLSGLLLPALSFQAFEASYTKGVTVAAGDVNGDGVDEIFVGTAEGSDRIGIFDQALVKLAEIRTGSATGVRLASADVNGDSFADLVVGRSTGGTNAVNVFSGLTKTNILDLSGYTITGTAGIFVG